MKFVYVCVCEGPRPEERLLGNPVLTRGLRGPLQVTALDGG